MATGSELHLLVTLLATLLVPEGSGLLGLAEEMDSPLFPKGSISDDNLACRSDDLTTVVAEVRLDPVLWCMSILSSGLVFALEILEVGMFEQG